MPMDKRLYPANWQDISRSRREQAGNRCEWCGVANHLVILRRPRSREYLVFDAETGGFQTPDGTPIRGSEEPNWVEPDQRLVRVRLSVAHLDHDTTNNADSNLACLCQRCHLNHDRADNIPKRRRTFRKKRIARQLQHDIEIGQARLFD